MLTTFERTPAQKQLQATCMTLPQIERAHVQVDFHFSQPEAGWYLGEQGQNLRSNQNVKEKYYPTQKGNTSRAGKKICQKFQKS